MGLISNFIFLIILSVSLIFFYKNIKKIINNINLGKDHWNIENKRERWKKVFFIAFGQSKMFKKPLVALLHLIVYAGFIIINIEILEIIIDGLFGTHRVFSFLGGLYSFLIGSFEVLAFLVLFSCIIFLIRRNILRIKRLWNPEMKGWPTTDANLILIFEILLMSAFLFMDAADLILQERGYYSQAGTFPVSEILITPFLTGLSDSSLILIERFCWWFHIIGIFGFLNYLVVSKHLHIILAFPNTYYSNLNPKGQFSNMDSVTNEVKMMLNPNNDLYAQNNDNIISDRFGAKDVQDLSKIQLLNAYSCTECGRCTSECPANITGKKLSPRKIMMDVRDRVDEVGKGIRQYGSDFNDGKALLNDYVTGEEIWACTSCNACVEACPISIDPLSIIIELRRYAVMEESNAPTELNTVFSNIENNGAPWQFPVSDRLKWKDDE